MADHGILDDCGPTDDETLAAQASASPGTMVLTSETEATTGDCRREEDITFSAEELAAIREATLSAPTTSPANLLRSEEKLRFGASHVSEELARFVDAAVDETQRGLGVARATASVDFEVLGARRTAELWHTLSFCLAMENEVGEAVGYIGVDASLAFAAIEHAYGATFEGDPEAIVPPFDVRRTTLTELESAVVEPFVMRIGTAFADAFFLRDTSEAVSTTRKQDGAPTLKCARHYAEKPGSLVKQFYAVWHLHVDVETRAGAIVVIGSSELIGRLVGARVSSDSSLEAERMASHLREVEVDCEAVLGTARLPLWRVLGLQVGDVLRLDSNQTLPIPLCFGGIPKFMATPRLQQGCYAVELVEEIP